MNSLAQCCFSEVSTESARSLNSAVDAMNQRPKITTRVHAPGTVERSNPDALGKAGASEIAMKSPQY